MFRGEMYMQQLSPGQSREVSLICGYDPSSLLACNTLAAHSGRRNACSMKSVYAASGPQSQDLSSFATRRQRPWYYGPCPFQPPILLLWAVEIVGWRGALAPWAQNVILQEITLTLHGDQARPWG